MAEILEEELRAAASPSSSSLSVVKDLFAGAVGGVAQVLIGGFGFFLFLFFGLLFHSMRGLRVVMLEGWRVWWRSMRGRGDVGGRLWVSFLMGPESFVGGSSQREESVSKTMCG
jgi:hypothetical protein